MKNGLVTSVRRSRVIDLPINCAQTELRSGRYITVFSLKLEIGQRVELRSLKLAMLAVLTPDVTPVYLNSALGLCSVGLYRGNAVCSPLAYAMFTTSTTTSNPFAPCIVDSPGTYSVVLSNNTSNTDFSVAVTGALKLYF